MTNFYIDVSHYDWDRHGGNLDWAAIKQSGVDLAFIRATYGDPEVFAPTTRFFREMARAAKAAGLKVGGYHNLIHGDAASIKRQVTWFRKELASVAADYAMIDVEQYEALQKNGLWPRVADAEAFAKEFSTVDTDRKLAVYLPRWVWNGYLKSADLRPLMTLAGGPLISSNYPSGSTNGTPKGLYALAKGDNGPGWTAYGNVTPGVWQYSSSSTVPGASSQTDVNAYKSTFIELDTLLRKESSMAWELTKNLIAFRNQMNAAFPNRDKATDGSIGDWLHSKGTSGHNPDDTDLNNAECDSDSDNKSEVRAIDIDKDTRDPNVSMEDIVQHLLKLARAGKLSVIKYIIYNKRIWSASSGWVQKAYNGANTHTEHLHLSGACNQAADEAGNFDYKLDELVDNMANITQEEFTTLYLNAIKNEAVMAQEKARPWQYVGGGIPEGMSVLGVLSGIYSTVRALGAVVASESTNPEELQAALDAVPTALETANAVVDQLGTAPVDTIAETLRSVLNAEKLAQLKAAL